ncbi:homing endonuclease [Yersinia phage MHG19]|nr:homing endonuclease [Yersinia phage MHG19]
MHYIIYKITNKINGKIYVGAHATVDVNDSYMGSGVNIIKSIKKYGKENFDKHILHNFSSSEEMYVKEAEIVNEDFVMRADTYNAALGGKGNPVIVHLQDPSYREMLSTKTKLGMTQEVRDAIRESRLNTVMDESVKDKISDTIKRQYHGSAMDRTGSKMSEESKAKIRAAQKGLKKVFTPMIIEGVEFDRYEDAGLHFNVSYKTIQNWIKSDKKPNCFLK